MTSASGEADLDESFSDGVAYVQPLSGLGVEVRPYVWVENVLIDRFTETESLLQFHVNNGVYRISLCHRFCLAADAYTQK